MTGCVLILNAGASRLKFAHYDRAVPLARFAEGSVSRIASAPWLRLQVGNVTGQARSTADGPVDLQAAAAPVVDELDGLGCGAIVPGTLLHLIEGKGMGTDAVSYMLYRGSGLLGVSGISGDKQVLLASDAPQAAEMIDLFVYRTGRAIGPPGTLGGLDALVFTGGIGENAPVIRQQLGDATSWLGAEIDADANQHGKGKISSSASAVAVLVLPVDEELAIAEGSIARLDHSSQGGR